MIIIVVIMIIMIMMISDRTTGMIAVDHIHADGGPVWPCQCWRCRVQVAAAAAASLALDSAIDQLEVQVMSESDSTFRGFSSLEAWLIVPLARRLSAGSTQ